MKGHQSTRGSTSNLTNPKDTAARVQSPAVALSRRSCDHDSFYFLINNRPSSSRTTVVLLLSTYVRGICEYLEDPMDRILTQVTPNINFLNQSIFEIARVFGVVEVPMALRESVKPVSSKVRVYVRFSTPPPIRGMAWYQGGRLLRRGINNGLEGA